MWQSPIHINTLKPEIDIDGEIVKAVWRYGVEVDKEELLRALQYDRDQYQKGYADGKADAQKHGYWVGIEYDGYADGCPVYHLWECSCCHDEFESEGDPPPYDYCPDCGAKMDGEPPEEFEDEE